MDVGLPKSILTLGCIARPRLGVAAIRGNAYCRAQILCPYLSAEDDIFANVLRAF